MSIWRDCQLHTSINDRRDHFNFYITKFPFLSSNIPYSPVYGVFISLLKRYTWACSSYVFLFRGSDDFPVLVSYSNGYLMERLKAKQKYQGMLETQTSGNKTNSGEIGLNIRTLASPKVRQDQVIGGVSVLFLAYRTRCMFYENLAQLGKKSKDL